MGLNGILEAVLKASCRDLCLYAILFGVGLTVAHPAEEKQYYEHHYDAHAHHAVHHGSIGVFSLMSHV